MADNTQRRKDELFTNIQQQGQLSLFDISPSCTSTAEGEILTETDIENMLRAHIRNLGTDTRITVFLARFCNEHGIVCPFNMIYTILDRLAQQGAIEIIRNPELTKLGSKRRFWDEKDGKTVIIRRRSK